MAKATSPKQPKPKVPRQQPGVPKTDPDETIYDDPSPAEGEGDEDTGGNGGIEVPIKPPPGVTNP